MATTNKAIIEAYKAAHGISIDTPLYTYGVWYNKGYRVKSGERCRHRVPMWKYSTKHIETNGEKKTVGRCFNKVMNLFEADQVERMG